MGWIVLTRRGPVPVGLAITGGWMRVELLGTVQVRDDAGGVWIEVRLAGALSAAADPATEGCWIVSPDHAAALVDAVVALTGDHGRVRALLDTDGEAEVWASLVDHTAGALRRSDARRRRQRRYRHPGRFRRRQRQQRCRQPGRREGRDARRAPGPARRDAGGARRSRAPRTASPGHSRRGRAPLPTQATPRASAARWNFRTVSSR